MDLFIRDYLQVACMSHFDPLRTTDGDCPECGAYVPEVDRLKGELKEALKADKRSPAQIDMDCLMNAAACMLAECGHLEYPSIALLRAEVERIKNEL